MKNWQISHLFLCLFVVATATSQPKQLTVPQDGAASFRTVQAASDLIPENNKKRVTLGVKNGVDKEKIFLYSLKRFVTFVGKDKFKTILTYTHHTGKVSPKGDTINTYTFHSFF